MKQPALPHKQSGVILLIFLMIIIVGGTGIFLSSSNATMRTNSEQQELVYQMEQAKQALIAFAVHYHTFGDVDGTGYDDDESPGHFPCPDTDNDGEPDSPCDNYVRGRLPQFITLPNGSNYRFNDAYTGLDRQFWYVVSPGFGTDSSTALNTATPGGITVDGQTDVFAVLIAPGIALASQDRANGPLVAANYLEGANTSGSGFSNSNAADPGNFNDIVLPVYANEVRTAMAEYAAETIMEWNDYVHDNFFNSYLPAFYPWSFYDIDWLINQLSNSNSGPLRYMHANFDNWKSSYTYNKVTPNVSTITWDNCGITFTMTHNAGLTKSQPAC